MNHTGTGAWLYGVVPLVGWFAAGSLKFALNSLRLRRPAFREIGYGGMPSTHATIVGTTGMFVGGVAGFSSPVFTLAVALAFIVALDAVALRREVGRHASALNALRRERGSEIGPELRESMGHAWPQVLAGLALGCVCGTVLLFVIR